MADLVLIRDTTCRVDIDIDGIRTRFENIISVVLGCGMFIMSSEGGRIQCVPIDKITYTSIEPNND